jgi:hypothetical protein
MFEGRVAIAFLEGSVSVIDPLQQQLHQYISVYTHNDKLKLG